MQFAFMLLAPYKVLDESLNVTRVRGEQGYEVEKVATLSHVAYWPPSNVCSFEMSAVC